MKLFCNTDHELLRANAWDDAEKFFKAKYQEKTFEFITNAVGKLNNISDDIHCVVKVETDNSGAIKTIITKIEREYANTLLSHAKDELLKEI